jgi:polyhydroxyalkanoate synthesis regulator phasin
MILNNLDEIYQEVLEELSYRVGIINLRNKKHVDILSEILDTTELAEYKSDILGELYKNVIVELKFVSKSAYLAYKDKHKMRPDTIVTIGDKETTVGAISDTSKEKKAEPETTTKDGELKSVIAQKSIDKAAEDANDYINKINDNNLDKKTLSNAFQKILNGDTLTDAEKALANDWISIRVGGGNDVGFYIAQQKGDFLNNQSRLSVKFNLPAKIDNSEEWADSFNKKIKDNYGIRLTTQTGSYVNKKDFTAAKMNTKRKMVEYKSSKDGNAVTIEGNTYQKRPIPTIDSLVNSFVKKGETKEEARSAAKKVVASINRRNEMIDRLIKNGKTQMVDYGETNNNENRRKTLNNVTQSTKKAVIKSIANFSGLSEDEIKQQYGPLLNKFDELEKFAPINNPNWDSMSSEEKANTEEQYQKQIIDILQDLRRDEKLSSGGPDIAEVFTFMIEIGSGKQAFLPSESNFPTIDIISLGEQKSPPANLSPDELAEFYSEEFSANSVSFIDSDGESIKLGNGGASAGPSKWRNSTFENPKTLEKLDNLMDTYNSTFGGYPPSSEAIDNAQKSYNDTKAYTKQILISKGYSEKEAQKLIDETEKKGKVAYNQARKAYQKSLEPGEELDSEFERGLELYNNAGMMVELLYNNDLESNNFGNVRFVESGKGKTSKISLEVLDGINEKCCVKFNPNPGEMRIKKDPKSGKATAGINVSFSTYITHCK